MITQDKLQTTKGHMTMKKHIHTFIYYFALVEFLMLVALFSGVQIVLPLPEAQEKQAKLQEAQTILASSIFDAVEPKKRKK